MEKISSRWATLDFALLSSLALSFLGNVVLFPGFCYRTIFGLEAGLARFALFISWGGFPRVSGTMALRSAALHEGDIAG